MHWILRDHKQAASGPVVQILHLQRDPGFMKRKLHRQSPTASNDTVLPGIPVIDARSARQQDNPRTHRVLLRGRPAVRNTALS